MATEQTLRDTAHRVIKERLTAGVQLDELIRHDLSMSDVHEIERLLRTAQVIVGA